MQGSRQLVRPSEVIGPLGVVGAVDERTPSCPVPTTNHDIEGPASVLNLHGVGRAALRMSRRQQRREGDAAKLHGIATAKHPVDRVRLSAGLQVSQRRNILLHDHDLGAGQCLHLGVAFLVIHVGVTAKDDSDVTEPESELLDASPDGCELSFVAAVDEDMAIGRGDQIGGVLGLGGHKVDIPDDLERFHEGFGRAVRSLSQEWRCTQRHEQHPVG